MSSKLETKINYQHLIKFIPEQTFKNVKFRDISPLFFHPHSRKELFEGLVLSLQSLTFERPHHCVLMESRGFLMIPMCQNNYTSVILARKRGKLPGETEAVEYKTEYSKDVMEVQVNLFKNDIRDIIIVDDILATGGTAKAMADLCVKLGKQIKGFIFIMEISGLPGRTLLEKEFNVPVISLVLTPGSS